MLWSLLGLLFVVTFVYLFLNSRSKEVEYEIVTPHIADIERSTVLTGKIEPRDEIEVKPQISGIISEINVEAGDIVQEGDIIAKIKVIPDEQQLSSAQNRVNVARIALDDVKVRHERNTMLYDRKVISREEFEQTQIEERKAKEELASALDAYSIVKEGISTSNATQSNTLVRATITGLVLDVPVKVGSSVIQANTMNDGTTVATIADMNKLIFKGKVDETEVGQLSVGQEMDIMIGAVSDSHPKAVIEYISPKGSDSNGASTFEIKGALVSLPQGIELRSGYSANATVSLGGVKGVLAIPESVIEFSGDSTFVYLQRDSIDHVEFVRTPIVTGVSNGVDVEVLSGLNMKSRIRGREKQGPM